MKTGIRFPLAAATAALVALAACAGGPSSRPMDATAAIGNHRIADRLMEQARDAAGEGDCAAALPTFRVLAANGEGFEDAQTELAECALDLAASAPPDERDLLLLEAQFWLERAAFANHPQAQARLASLYGAADGFGPDRVKALGWAMVYNANGGREPLSLAAIDRRGIDKIRNEMTSEEQAAAIAFANSFRPLTMDAFTPPRAERGRAPGEGGPPGARRRPRR